MKKKTIKRCEQQYKDIESFKDYELTNCISFEMAIRNSNVLSMIEEYVSNKRNNLVCHHNDLYSYFINEKDFIDNPHELDNINYTSTMNTSLSYYNFSKFYNKEYNQIPFKYTIDISNNDLTEDIHDEFDFVRTHGFALVSCHTDIEINNQIREETGDEIIDAEVKYLIYNNFKRPLLAIPYKYYRKLNLMKVNFNLPLNELQAQIKNIYTQINFKSIIKTPFEILGTILEKANNEMCYNKPRGKEECLNANKYLTIQQKLADMFYIYDAYKISMKQQDIQYELTSYYDNRSKDTTIINEIYAVAKEYIDNLKYKELITGIKNSNTDT